MLKSKSVYYLLFFLLCTTLIPAQERVEGLIINEIFLDAFSPFNNWIEIYNPTNDALTLSQFAISTFLTPNLFQGEAFVIEKNDYFLICAGNNVTSKKKQDQDKMIIIKELQLVGDGGIIQIGTKEKGMNGYDICKYGIDYYSDQDNRYKNKELVPFCPGGISYSRNTSNAALEESNFYESEPTPFCKNK